MSQELFSIRDLDSGSLVGFDLDVECYGITTNREYTIHSPNYPCVVEDTEATCQFIIDSGDFPFENVEIVQLGVLND